MRLGFSLEQELKWAKEIRFPLNIIYSYEKGLKAVYERFENAVISSSVLSQEEKNEIQKYTEGILKSYRLQIKGKYMEAFSLFDGITAPIKDKMLFTLVGYKNNFSCLKDSYYRIVDTSSRKYNYLQMLHVPFKYREKISTNRYSAPGIPCTYMSSMKTPAWYECGLPDHFQIATYNADYDCKKKLLQLDIRPLDFFHELKRESIDENISVGKINDVIKMYYYIFPLLAACSFTSKMESKNFADKYVIPQLLMTWVLQDEDIIGIRYTSNAFYEKIGNFNSYNIAIPARYPFDTKGYSKELKRIFNVNTKASIPIQKIDFQKKFNETYGAQIQEIFAYKRTLREIIRNKRYPTFLEGYYAICNVIEANVEGLKNSCGTAKYPHILTLSTMYELSEKILRPTDDPNKCISQIPVSNKEIMQYQLQKERFEKDIMPIIFNLKSLDYSMWEWTK